MPLAILALLVAPFGDPRDVVPEPVFRAILGEISGERALGHLREIARHHRIQASPGYDDAAAYVIEQARAAGLQAVASERFPSDGEIVYGTFLSPVSWSPREGELREVSPNPRRICHFPDVPTCLSTLSKGGAWEGEVIDVGPGTQDADYERKDVRGRIVLATGYAGSVHREAVIERGALGVVIAPSPSDRPEFPDMVRYNGLWPTKEEIPKVGFGFQLSARQAADLRRELGSGKVVLHAKVDADLGPGALHVVRADIPGTEPNLPGFLLSAHLDHYRPGADDNASGSATLLEIGRALVALIRRGDLPAPRRTITFLWVPEYFGTAAWVNAHPDLEREFVGGFNLDMTGADPRKTNAHLSCIRTPLQTPTFLNDLAEALVDQIARANPVAPTGSRMPFHFEWGDFQGGSDHDVLCDVGVPSLGFGYWDDVFHHTNLDLPDNQDATSLLRCATIGAAGAYAVAAASLQEAQRWRSLVEARSKGRQAALAWAGASAERQELQQGVDEAAALSSARLDNPNAVATLGSTARSSAPLYNRSFRGPFEDSYASPWVAQRRRALGRTFPADLARAGEIRRAFLAWTTGRTSHDVIEGRLRAEFGADVEKSLTPIVEDLEALGLIERR
jgi:aminopeptidase YwaD